MYGCFLVSSHFVLAPCDSYGLKSCSFCDEKLMLSFCAARDTHFSASIVIIIIRIIMFRFYCQFIIWYPDDHAKTLINVTASHCV